MKSFSRKIAALVPLAFALNAMAGETTLMNIKLESVSVIGGTPTGAHAPGNMEIRIPPNMIPAGVNCAGNGGNEYITWKLSNDPDRSMLHILQDAILNGKSVNLRITDLPALTAWGQRCSLVAAGVNKL